MPKDYTFLSRDAGVHTFRATLVTSGTQALTARDTVTASITGTQTGIQVIPARLLVSGFPSPTTAGVSQVFTVTVLDADGTTATGYTGTVHFTSSDRQAVLPADYTFTAADAGLHSFTATLKTAGTQRLLVTDTVTRGLNGAQVGIVVNPAAASSLQVRGFPSPTTAGVAHSFSVTAKDPYGNTATGYAGTVHFTSSDGQRVLPADYSFTATDAGAHAFSATLETAGSQSITATDTVNSSITGTQSRIRVNAAAASTLLVAGFPSPTVAGVSHTFTVTALDPYGNRATAYRGTVHFSSSDGQVVLPADYTFTASDSGRHTFRATLKTAGRESITATDTVTSSITGTQAGIQVNPAAASHFVLSAPANVSAGVPFNFTVTAYDGFGNIATGYTGTVHFTSSDKLASLPSNYTFTAGDQGSHILSATLQTSGSQSITATDVSRSSLNGTDSAILVAALDLFTSAETEGTDWMPVEDLLASDAEEALDQLAAALAESEPDVSLLDRFFAGDSMSIQQAIGLTFEQGNLQSWRQRAWFIGAEPPQGRVFQR